MAAMRRTILVLSVLLALAGTAPASAAFLAANSPPGEKLLDTGCLKVFGDLSRELPPGSGGAWLERAAECFVAPANALGEANFAQRTFSESFSQGGKFAGQTIDDVAGALRSGRLSPADVPVEYAVRDGNTLILNTRSAQALERAGIPRSQWNAVNVTGDAAAEARLTGQLQRNNLTNQGIPTVRPSGGN
jgi:hypothetical protein